MEGKSKLPYSVLVVVCSLENQVLLLERARHPGYWQSVTGSLEEGETKIQTARRELLEETGICAGDNLVDWHYSNCFNLLELWRHRYAPEITHNTEYVFSLTIPTSTTIKVAATEHRNYCWLPWQEAAKTCFSWSNRDAILMLQNSIQSC